jgi:hypothetical protein
VAPDCGVSATAIRLTKRVRGQARSYSFRKQKKAVRLMEHRLFYVHDLRACF